ncbi:MAG: biotin--[acetyl-CoA-carboxylase] ligase [Phycisphaeraceae bacterium]|nr:biotin--[acetyl-CoA-carboxylase] ligase [Phycisphaeraceae bacterium]
MLVFRYPILDSTNAQARRLQRHNPRSALLVIAARQDRGRGRYGRSWVSPRGGAWWTLTWPLASGTGPTALTPIITGLVVAQTIETVLTEVSGGCPWVKVGIKWPNDLLIDGGKIAGILCERWQAPSAGADDVLAIGVGINVAFDLQLLGTLAVREQEGKPAATTILAQTGARLPIDALIERSAAELERRLPAGLRGHLDPESHQAIEERLAWRGEPVVIRQGDRRQRGVLLGIDPQGRLKLRRDDGSILLCEAGELCRASEECGPSGGQDVSGRHAG